MVEAHQCHLRNLMPRISLAFALLQTETGINVIGVAAGGL